MSGPFRGYLRTVIWFTAMFSVLAATLAIGTIPGATASVVTPALGIVEPDGALFTRSGSYLPLGPLNAPIVGWAPRPAGGVWEVATDGGVFSRSAPFFGSMGGRQLTLPIVGMAATPDGAGYWLVASDGGIFTFGNAPFFGSVVDRASAATVSIAPIGGGYDVVLVDGSIWQFGAGNSGTQLASLPISSGYQAGPIAQKAVSVAMAQVGKPYVIGGSGPGGFDCSGLTQFAYAAAGIALPRTAAQQFAAVRHVALADAQPGDLLFFYPGITHVGIYLGNGLMVHAAHVGTNVQVEAFAPWFGPVMGVGRPGGP